MKKLYFLVVFIVIHTAPIFSQNNTSKYDLVLPKTYLGVAAGLNSPSGALGLRLDYNISENVLLDFAGGFGTWGYKTGIGVILNTARPKAWCPFVGLSFASGNNEWEMSLQNQNKLSSNQILELKPVSLLNIGIQHQWHSRKMNRYFVEFGYSFPFKDPIYTIQNPVFDISIKSKEQVEFLKPGGLRFAFGYSLSL